MIAARWKCAPSASELTISRQINEGSLTNSSRNFRCTSRRAALLCVSSVADFIRVIRAIRGQDFG